MYEQVESTIDAAGLHVGLAVSRYHADVTDRLREAAVSTFVRAGGRPEDVLVAPAPGAFELIVVSSALASRGDIDAVAALGCIITGETRHDEYLSHAVAQGLALLSTRGIPVTFGVLTCGTLAQAEARAGGDQGNKGAEAMAAAVQAANVVRALRGDRASAEPPPGPIGVA